MLQIKHTGDLRQALCDPRTLPGGGNCNSGLHHSTILSPRDCKLLGRCRMPLGSELLSPLLTYSSVRYQSTHSYSSNRSNCSPARSRRLALPQFETTVASRRQLHSSNNMATDREDRAMENATPLPEERLEPVRTRAIMDLLGTIHQAISRIIVGKDEVIRLLLAALLADGHILLEDVPGTGKTKLAHSARPLGAHSDAFNSLLISYRPTSLAHSSISPDKRASLSIPAWSSPISFWQMKSTVGHHAPKLLCSKRWKSDR